MIKGWLRKESSGGVLLLFSTVLAIMVANSGLTESYQRLLHLFAVQSQYLPHNLLGWVNDGLMAIFFFSIGLEVRQELKTGSLASRSQASLPIIAALGGMLFPALIYISFNGHSPTLQSGWAIPVATDIAFALGIISLVSNRIPDTVKFFLMALAIIDDLGAIVVIACCYSAKLALLPLVFGLVIIIVLACFNRLGLSAMWPRYLLGITLWFLVLASGVHPTIAGVITGLFFPVTSDATSPAIRIAEKLRLPVNFVILPVFAFANAGIQLTTFQLPSASVPLFLGIVLGLLLGKPIGICFSCYLAVKFKVASLPENCNFKLLMKISVLCGIGFTMAIFIASLAFYPESLLNFAKIAILSGSLVAAVIGYVLLKREAIIVKQ